MPVRKLAIGATGFEPTTSASQKQRSTKLSYAPLRWEEEVLSLNSDIITLLMTLVKRSPVFPVILMHCPHPKDGEEDKGKPHDA